VFHVPFAVQSTPVWVARAFGRDVSHTSASHGRPERMPRFRVFSLTCSDYPYLCGERNSHNCDFSGKVWPAEGRSVCSVLEATHSGSRM
jgi:hypothetical protein